MGMVLRLALTLLAIVGLLLLSACISALLGLLTLRLLLLLLK